MFTKVLIANRGAIACRIMRTLRRLNVVSVAVYTEADALSRHVTEADEVYCIGEGIAAESYLRTDKILAIAQQTGAQAIHPGYGFLSENADFAGQCAAHGISFIGPTPQQMRAFGNAQQPEASALSIGFRRAGHKAFAVVVNRQLQLPGATLNQQARFGRLRMFQNVVDAFLHEPVKIDFRFLRKHIVNRV